MNPSQFGPASGLPARRRQSLLRRLVSAALPLAGSVLVATCGIDQLTGSGTHLDVALSSDTVVVVGATKALVPSAANGATLAGVQIAWTSANAAVATVDANGLVTGVGEGAAKITATLSAPELPPEGLAVSRTFVVQYGGIAITAVDSLTGLGQTVAPIVRGTDAANAPRAAVAATLASSDPTILAASGNTVTARKNGSVTLTATYNGLTAQAAVKVRQVAKRISFGVTPFVFKSLLRDTSVQTSVFDTRDSLITAPVLTWSSVDQTVATFVNAAGTMRALKVGATSVRASVDTVTASLPVSVSQAPVSLVKTAGDAQTQTAGIAVPALPTVTLTDAGGAPIAGAAVTFSVASGGGSITGAVQTTDAAGKATVGSWTLGTTAGVNSLLASAGSLNISFGATGSPGAPAKLTIQQAPATTQTVGAVLAPALQVAIRDANNNLVTTATTAVTVALGANPGSATLGGTLAVNAVAGVAVFGDLTISAPGAGYTLAASATGLAGATTSAINVVGPATKLAFTVQPASATAGTALAPAVQVTVQDGAGQTVTGATNTITLAIGANPGSGALSGTATVAAASGVATFSNLSIDKAGAGYTLTAAASGLSGTTSSAFTISAGAASKLVYLVQPSSTAPASAITPALQVAVEDALGNVVTSSTATITIAIGTNPAAGTLSGTTSAAAVAGVATFGALQINNAGNGYTLVASATGLTGATSAPPFNILGPGTPRALKFVTQPSTVTAGSAIAPSVTVKVVDSVGTTVNTSTAAITLGFGANPNSGTLAGTLTANAVAGVATFANVKVNRAGGGYTLAAATTGLTNDTSAAFTVNPGSGTVLVFTQQPTSVAAGAVIAPAITVAVQDGQGNTVTSASTNVTLAIGSNPGASTLTGGAATATSGGVATFSGVSLNKVGTNYTLAASATGLTGAISSTFNVTVGAPAVLAITTQPTNVAVGAVLTTVAVTVKDAGGNTVTTATTPVSLALASNAAGATLGGTVTVAAASGVASFTTLTLDKPGQGFTLQAAATGLTPVTTSAFNAIGLATALVITTQPTTTIRNGVISNVVVEGRDAAGNRATAATNPVTLAIATNPNFGTLGGTLVRNLAAGVATFSSLTIDSAGTGYTLQATGAGLTTAVSSAFDINAFGAAAKLAFLTQPSNTDAGAVISPAVQVLVQDAQGNTVTNSTASVTMVLGGPSTTLGGTNPQSASAGVAAFNDLTVGAAGAGYVLTATATGLASGNSGTFTVTVLGAAQRLRFDVQPTNTTAGSNIAPAIVVSAVNSSNQIVATATGTMTLSVDSGPIGATLSTQASFVSGQATFSTAKLTVAGSYHLRATGAGLTAAVSQTFTINPGAANKLAFLDTPPAAVAGRVMQASIRVEIEDQYGNRVPTAANQVRLGLSQPCNGGNYGAPPFGSGPGIDGDTIENAQAGVATFTALRPRTYADYNVCSAPATKILNATTTGLVAARSSAFAMQPSPAVTLKVATQPPASVTGQRTFNVYFAPTDSLGNYAALGTEVVTAAIQSGPGNAHLSGTTSAVAPASSYATVSPMVDSLGTYILTASSPGMTSVNTSVFTAVASTAAQLGFGVTPSNTTVGAIISPAVRVCVLDAFQNEVRTATGSLTIAIGTNPGSATLGGTKTLALTNGCANFTDLTLSAVGNGYTLSVTPTGVTGVSGAFISSTFNITP